MLKNAITKKTIIEMIIIVTVATIIALLYNYLRADGIPFIPKSKKELMVSDSLLFGGIFNQDTTNNENIEQNAIQKNDLRDTATTVNAATVEVVPEQTATPPEKVETAETIDAEAILRNASRTKDNYRLVSFEQMKRIVDLNDDNFVIIDARNPAQYAEARIPRAINIPPEDEIAAIEKLLQLPKTKTFIIYCDGGNCGASNQIAALLDNFGYQRFFIYEAGWEEWIQKK